MAKGKKAAGRKATGESSESADFLSQCERAFGSRDLYVVVGFDDARVRSELTASHIKKRYYKSSLVYHPDKADSCEDADATHKFQLLSKAYSVLADEQSRQLYDQTGAIAGLDSLTSDVADWYAYWRNMFKPLTIADLDEFAAKYRESEEELADLKAAYVQQSGCMRRIMECMMCSTADDERRYAKLLDDAIESGDVPHFDAFRKETGRKKTTRKRKADREATEAEQLLREIQGKRASSDASELASAIRNRASARAAAGSSFLQQLELKYASPSAAGSKKSKGGKGNKP